MEINLEDSSLWIQRSVLSLDNLPMWEHLQVFHMKWTESRVDTQNKVVLFWNKSSYAMSNLGVVILSPFSTSTSFR